MNEPTDGTKLPESTPETPPSVAAPPLPQPWSHIAEVPPPVPVAVEPPAGAPPRPAPVPPPLPVAAPAEPSILLKAVTAGLGLGVVCLALVQAGRDGRDISYRIGAVIGSLAVWPLIVIGLFSIARKYRTSRTRLIICAVVWGISCLGIIGNLTAPGKRSRLRTPERSAAAPANAGDDSVPVAAPPAVAETAAPLLSPAPAGPAGAATFDFSPGSNERLVALMDGVQKERYREISAAYARACAQRPTDARLALERVRFIERFAYSEELEIEEAGPDHEAAVQYLTTRFPDAPGTILYQLQQTNYEELDAKAEKYERRLGGWSAEERAQYLLLRARAADNAELPIAYAYARDSFRLNPTVGAGLLLAQKAHEKKNDAECLATLTHAVFAEAEVWTKKQKLELLLKIREPARAGELYAELKAGTEDVLLDAATATALAEGGLVTEAREVFAGLGANEWQREQSSLPRFVFELAHGTPAQAEEAYRAMRADRLNADPYLRYRYELFRKQPSASWNTDDLTGLLVLGVVGAVVAVLPLLLLLPVHYWSLLRGRKGKSGGWPGALWGLRQAWLALGALLVFGLAALWLLEPETMRSWVTGEAADSEILPRPSLLLVQAIDWLVMGLLVAALVWHRRAWRLLGPGQWTAGKSIGVGVLAALALRMLAGLYVRIWPAAASGEMAALSQTAQLCLELLKTQGPFAFLAAIALFVPLFEETLFRGILLQAFGKHLPFFWANAAQALAFGLVHENFLMLPFYFTLGFVCGELTRRAGGLLPALIVHACNNALAGLVLIFLHRSGL